jgi:UDP-N-acetyl-2-amino-2-deoxyglucuronate dehydrogenase
MTEKLTVGVIGCGEITSKRRASQFDTATNVRIRMVMDVNRDVAEDISDRFGVPYTTDQDELLSRDDIDVVYIATPHHLHTPQAIAVAEAGKHVLVEKPISTSLSGADEVIDTCRHNGVKLCVCDPCRYGVEYQTASELIDSGYLGEIVGTKIAIMARKPDSYWEGGYTGRVTSQWRASEEKSGGGVLSINGVHNIDGMRYLTGLEAERVFCEYDTFATPVAVEDFCVATVRYTNGGIGIIETSSFLQDGPYDETLRGDRVYGTKGEIIIADPVRIRTNDDTDLGDGETWHQIPTADRPAAGVRLIEDFTTAITHDTEPPVTGEDGRVAIELVHAAYRAGQSEKPVSLPLSE